MSRLSATFAAPKCAVEVVRRLFVSGAILDKTGHRLVQVEICDMHSTALAYASDITLPEIARIIDGEAYRCQLKWEKTAFPIGWRMLGLARTPTRGDTAFNLVPRTRILTDAHVVPFEILVGCIVEPTLRRFLSDVFSDRDFVMRYFSAPTESLAFAENPAGPLVTALEAISHYWYTPGLTENQQQLGAIALLFTAPGSTWVSSGGGQSALLNKHPQFPVWAVQDMARAQPRWWQVLLTIWAENNAAPVAHEAYVPPVMKAAYHLARAHARTVNYLKRTDEYC